MREMRGFTSGRLAVLVLAIAVAVPASSCRPSTEADKSATPVRLAAYPAQLPEGPGKDIAERSCLSCHSAPLITQQAKDSTAWAKTLATMEKWSAPMPPPQRDSLLTYLVAHQVPGLQ